MCSSLTPDNRLKMWGDWKFNSFLNYIKGIDLTMANDMDHVERELEASYGLDAVTDETKGRAVILRVKKENGFEAWQILSGDATCGQNEGMALLSLLSRVQFAEGKTVSESEQLPQFHALLYERDTSHGACICDGVTKTCIEDKNGETSSAQVPKEDGQWTHLKKEDDITMVGLNAFFKAVAMLQKNFPVSLDADADIQWWKQLFRKQLA